MLLFALSDAVVTGGAALAGAIVGALAGGVAEFILQRRREAADARAGARLLQAELSGAASQLVGVENERKWWVVFDMSLPSWDTYRGALAAQLPRAAWMAVSQAVIELRGLEQGMTQRMSVGTPGAVSPGFEVAPSTVKSAAARRKDAATAYNALCKLADTEPTEQLPGEPPGSQREPAH